MGAGVAKLLPYLDAGTEAKEDKLKKRYARILTSGSAPDKPELVWKVLSLNPNDVQATAKNLIEGANFIQSARLAKQNIFVSAPENDVDAVVFATAYMMLLSGLPAREADQAITNAFKEGNLNFERKYQKALEYLRELNSPKAMREEMFKSAGALSSSKLTEDVCKIYELAGLVKPSAAQISLDEMYTERRDSKRGSIFSGFSSRKSSKDEGKLNTPESRSPKQSKGSLELKVDRRGSRDSNLSVESPRPTDTNKQMTSNDVKQIADMVEENSQHIDPALLKSPPNLSEVEHPPEVNFEGHPGESNKSSTDSVTELNSVQMKAGTNISEVGKAHVSEAQISLNEQPIQAAKLKVAEVINTQAVPETQVSSNGKPMKAVEVNVTMKGLLASAKPPESSTLLESAVSDDSMTMLSKIKDSMDKPKAEPSHEKTASVINGDTGTHVSKSHPTKYKRKVIIVRRMANHDEHIKVVSDILAKRAVEYHEATHSRRSIRIVRVSPKVSG